MLEIATILTNGNKAIELFKSAMDLINSYENKKTKIFKKYIAPAYDGLQVVILAYFENINQYRKEIREANSKQDLRIALDEFSARRIRVILSRDKNIGTLKSYINDMIFYLEKRPDKKEEATEFLTLMISVKTFFNYTSLVENKTFLGIEEAEEQRLAAPSSSVARGLIEKSESIISGIQNSAIDIEEEKEILIDMCDSLSELLSKRAGNISASYASLQIDCEN